MIEIAVMRYLAANVDGLHFSIEGDDGTNVFLDHMPSSPDLAVMVTTNGGAPSTASTLQPNDEPYVQALCRGLPKDPRSCGDLAQAVYDQLVGLTSTVLDPGGRDEVHVVKATPQQTHPVRLPGTDANDRHERSVNVALFVERPTVHRP